MQSSGATSPTSGDGGSRVAMSDETRGSDAAAPNGGDARDDYTSERDSAVSTARKRRRAEGESEEDDGRGDNGMGAIGLATNSGGVRATSSEARDGGAAATGGNYAGDHGGDDGNGGDDGGEAINGSVAMAGGGDAGDDDGNGDDGGARRLRRERRRRRGRRLDARVAMACTTNGTYDVALQRTTAARYRGRLGQRSCIA